MRFSPFIAVILALLLAGVVVFFLHDARTPSADSPVTMEWSPDVATTSVPVFSNIPASWHTYENSTYHFSIAYPDDLTPTPYPGKNAARTLVFTNATGGAAFQIYIAPYAEKDIPWSRIVADTQNTAEASATAIRIGNLQIIAFHSNNPNGRLYEAWFLHNGYLYEATAAADAAQALNTVLATMVFK